MIGFFDWMIDPGPQRPPHDEHDQAQRQNHFRNE